MAEVEKNAVSLLKEYHDQEKGKMFPPPSYDFTSALALQNTVYFIAVCKYKKFLTEGEGRTKKDAQREAADKMLKKVKKKYEGVANASQKKLNFTQGENLSTVKAPVLPTPEPLMDSLVIKQTVEDFLNNFSNIEDFHRSLRNEQILMSQSYLDDVGIQIDISTAIVNTCPTCPVRRFEEVMQRAGLIFCVQIPETKPPVFAALLKISLNCMVIGGTGSSKENAVVDACQKALQKLSVLQK